VTSPFLVSSVGVGYFLGKRKEYFPRSHETYLLSIGKGVSAPELRRASEVPARRVGGGYDDSNKREEGEATDSA